MLKSGQKGTPGPIAKRKPTAFVLDDLHVLQTSKWSESLVKRLGLEKEENIWNGFCDPKGPRGRVTYLESSATDDKEPAVRWLDVHMGGRLM